MIFINYKTYEEASKMAMGYLIQGFSVELYRDWDEEEKGSGYYAYVVSTSSKTNH